MDLQDSVRSSALLELTESFCELDILGTRLHTNKHLYNSQANSNTSRLSETSCPRLSVLIAGFYEIQLELFLDLLPRIHVRQQWINSFIRTTSNSGISYGFSQYY